MSVLTQTELEALATAITHNCTCETFEQSAPCGVHVLIDRQPSVLRLVFYRRHADALRRAEQLEAPCWTSHPFA